MVRHIKLILFKKIYRFNSINRNTDQRSFRIILRCLNRAWIYIILIITDAFVRHLKPSGHEVTLYSWFESHDFPLADYLFIILFINIDHYLLSALFPRIPIIINLLILIFFFLFDLGIDLSGQLTFFYVGLPFKIRQLKSKIWTSFIESLLELLGNDLFLS